MQPDRPRLADASIAIVLLAAGASSRFGSENKLLAAVGGKPLVARVAAVLRDALPASPLIAVTRSGPDGQSVQDALAGYSIQFIENADAKEGISTSIRCGVDAVRNNASSPIGVLIAQGDMPNLTADLVRRLTNAFLSARGATITLPQTRDGTLRTPVIWPKSRLGDLQQLVG
ncbi:MAG: nucleotidyltransferase family protein, partial [Pseudomonadota bacterium]